MFSSDRAATSLSLLESDEPPAFEVVNAHGTSHAVLVCDHASNRVPRRLGALGLDHVQLADHIAWDPGAADVARRVVAQLDAPLVLSSYSRLVVDCNRPLQSAGLIAEHSAGVLVPGNHRLNSDHRAERIGTLFQPYHNAINTLLNNRSQRPTLLLSMHSFTPVLDNKSRPWHIGISNGADRRFAALMLHALAQDASICVGDNQPYPIDHDFDYTIPVHGDSRGLLNVMIEIRQDGIRTSAGAAAWAARLVDAYRQIEAEALSFY